MLEQCSPYDVVIVGSGGGGLRAAISAAERGCKTLIIAKGRINRSGSTLLAGANLSADIACDGGSLAEMGITDANNMGAAMAPARTLCTKASISAIRSLSASSPTAQRTASAS